MLDPFWSIRNQNYKPWETLEAGLTKKNQAFKVKSNENLLIKNHDCFINDVNNMLNV